MAYIHLTTFIAAPQKRVFDLSRHVGIHRRSMEKYNETIVDGVKDGMMNLGDTVTWKARHLFKARLLKVKITQFQSPGYFVDEQTEGDFALMKHEHYFKPIENGTLMIDQMRFESPYGIWGRLLNRLYLEKYMTRLLEQRNALLKSIAESNQWKQFINE